MVDKLSVLPHVVEAILTHVSGHRAGVAGIYNRARYEAEMRQALERWGEYVEKITVLNKRNPATRQRTSATAMALLPQKL
jgi:hypothetical protein